MDLIRWSTLAYTMSHDVVMLYAVVTLLYAVHSRSTHGVCIPTLCGVMDARSHRSHGSPHHRIMDHGDVVDHVLSLDVPGDGISISMAIGYRWYPWIPSYGLLHPPPSLLEGYQVDTTLRALCCTQQ